ncbi:MAG: hypothetical protein HPY76_06160 [Anaerolineae bacterium]|nr:hypothetical protein [Anaerolineae bacterium]
MQTYQTAQPPKYLEEYVDCYWILEKDAPAALEGTHRYLPLGCQELLVNFGNPWRDTEKPGARIPASSVSGQFIRRRTFITQGPIRIFSISFKPYGWSLLTGYPAFEFSNTMTQRHALERNH